ILVLPRVPEPGLAETERAVTSVTTAPSGYEGEGFPVRRAFAGVDLRALDPFVHMDQMGEVEYGPGEPKGTAWHPHRGFETVTYMIDGEMKHQDSHGGGGLIGGGDTQWMTAGSGILHIETPPWRRDFNALVYALGGNGTVGTEGRPLRSGQLAVLGDGGAITIGADAHQDSRTSGFDLFVLGGEPIREPVAAYGPFVMNTRA